MDAQDNDTKVLESGIPTPPPPAPASIIPSQSRDMDVQDNDIKALKKALIEKKLTLLIGSGVSINATTIINDQGKKQNLPYLTWPGLIQNGLNYLAEKKIVETFSELDKALFATYQKGLESCLSQQTTLTADDLVGMAGFVKGKLTKCNRYPDWQADVFKDLYKTHINGRQNAILDAIKLLHEAGARIMTTNYDDLLERHCGLESISPGMTEDIQTFFNREYQTGIFHVHGVWRRPRGTVLDQVDYSTITKDDTIQQSLKGMFGGTEVVVFVGTSGGMDDPNFGAMLEWATKEFQGIAKRHYMLVRTHETTVHPYVKSVFYGGGFDDLAPFLRKLVPQTGPTTDKAVRVVVNSGPLAHVNMDAKSLATAIQLATGADGWSKANERSESLIQLLSANQGQLVGTTSFRAEHYRELRKEFNAMQGVVVENREITTVEMPNASTAVSKNSGVTCLRALTTCLLCLCTAEATTAILQRLIPFQLVQHDKDDGILEMEGPLLASLRQWVSIVAAEEESNKLKDHLLESIDDALRELQIGAGLNEIRRATQYFDSGDEALILGVLKWILTPTHRRTTPKYPTRSLRVWAAATIMERLGFDVSPAYWIVNSQEEYLQRKQAASDGENTFEVFLAVSHHIWAGTDTMTEFVFITAEIPLPRATPLVNVPWYAFQHVKYMDEPLLKDEVLRSAYNKAFMSASQRFLSLQVNNFQVKLEISILDNSDIDSAERYKGLFTPFSPHIHDICVEPMTHFGPQAVDGVAIWENWEFSDYEALFQAIRTGRPSKIICNFYTTIAIVLGSLYGICSNVCLDSGETLTNGSEIAFNPDLLYRDDCKLIRSWAKTVGRALQGKASFPEWESAIFGMFVGAVGTAIGDRTATSIGETEPKGHILGVQSHGFTAVSDVLVNLRIRPEDVGYFHISRGQLLTLPVDEHGLVRASTYLPFAAQIQLGSYDQNNMESLHRSSHSVHKESTRLDVEPCWEDEPRTVVLKMRRIGITVASLNIGRVLERRSRNIIPCSCGKNSNEATVPISENWYHLLIADLSSYTYSGMNPGRLANLKREQKNFLIDASQSEDVLIYVLGIIDAHRIVIAKECLECAYQYHKRKGDHQRGVIVIPHDNILAADTEDQILERAKAVERKKVGTYRDAMQIPSRS